MVPVVKPAAAARHGAHNTMVAQAAPHATPRTAITAQLIPMLLRQLFSRFQSRPYVPIDDARSASDPCVRSTFLVS